MAMVYRSEVDEDGKRLVVCDVCGFERLTKWPPERVRHMCPGKGAGGHGPGWHLEQMLKQLGVTANAGSCRCLEKRAQMDYLGPEGCRQRLPDLMAHLQKAYDESDVITKIRAGALAIALGLPLSLEGLLSESIRRAEEESLDVLVSSTAVSAPPRKDAAVTVVYCTSNREDERFEQRIRSVLAAHADGLPIVSVSQKPLEFGHNICVGDTGASQENYVRQCLIGVEAAQTPFVVMVEADCLYPKDYFGFVPPTIDAIYYAEKACLLWAGRGMYRYKDMREVSGFSSRANMMHVLGELDRVRPQHLFDLIPSITRQLTFKTSTPIVSFKTGDGMHWKSPHLPRKTRTLPVWGDADRLWQRFSGP